MKVLKFGGSSLANGQGIENSLAIIEKRAGEEITIVVSARGNSTDELEELLMLAAEGKPFSVALTNFFKYQKNAVPALNLGDEFNDLDNILHAVQLLGEYSVALKDKVLAYGELISAKAVVHLLNSRSIKAVFVDSRSIIKTRQDENEVVVLHKESAQLSRAYFNQIESGILPVVTGFIASDMHGNTTSLGRNGSNYTATLIANYCHADEVENWTNIDGVYTANPKYVKNAKKIEVLSYREANELAHFGANILHAKTILPLIEKEIPIKILNTFKPEQGGTTINARGSGKGIKAVSIIEDVSLVSIEGRGMMGKVGIDARIFNALSLRNISVRMISQASSERGIGFIVNQGDAELARKCLQKEFSLELAKNDISAIELNSNLAIIAIIGRHNYALEKAISGLRRNKIWMYLINNSSNGAQISLVVANNDLKKAANVVHNQVFDAVKTLNIVCFGKGTVGATFVDQVVGTREDIINERKLQLSIVGVIDSKHFLFEPDGVGYNWREKLKLAPQSKSNSLIVQQVNDANLENVVVVDNTASKELVADYPDFIEAGFDLIASNKVANSVSFEFYQDLRQKLKQKNKNFLYETNVGAGLPLIDTLKLLHLSGEQIQKIRGVFSGSLSYIFNTFSLGQESFSEVLYKAKRNGLTEPDPREDLSGNDVARKLLILAREIGLQNELTDVAVQNLIPEGLQKIDGWTDFENHMEDLNNYYRNKLAELSANHVYRYVGELNREAGLKVELVEVDKKSSLGNISGSDSIFEIYTEAYGDQPIVIQGAGAGAAVTARGVYGDLLRLGSKL